MAQHHHHHHHHQHQLSSPAARAVLAAGEEEEEAPARCPAPPPPASSQQEEAAGGAPAAQRRPAALDLRSLRPCAAAGDENAADDEAALSPLEGAGALGTSSSRRGRFSLHPHHHPPHHMFHRPHSHSPSMTGLAAANGCGPLQAVPEDAVVSLSPSACEPPGSGSALSEGSPVPFAPRSISSSFCSEISIDSPSINLTLPCQEMPSGMLVAMVDRSAEMRELYERNAPFFEQITSGVLGHAPSPAFSSSAEKENGAAEELLPSRVKNFLDTLFAPREQLPDRLWIDAIESQLSAAPPAIVETFRELVGYESEEDYDAALPEEDQMWLPEYDQLKDVCCSGTNSDAGAESDAGDDVVVVSRGSRKDTNDEPGLDKGHLGRELAVDAGTVTNPSECELGKSTDRQAVSTGSKEELQQEDEEGRVEALAV